MKAKCSYCNDGCDKCESGYKEVKMATGELYTRHCNGCGEDNGGCVAASFLPPPDKWIPPGPCVWCASPDVIWLLVGEIAARVIPACALCAREDSQPEVTALVCSDCGEPVCSSHIGDHKGCEGSKNVIVH